MVLSMIIALNTAPALLGTQEAIRQGQAKEKREEHRARRCNLIANCVQSSKRSSEIDGRRVVLLNNKLYIDTGTGDDSLFGHPFAGYYLPYPDSDHEGLVSTITDEAPILNWIFIDQETYEVKHGVRAEAQPNITGPFDCTRQDRRLTFDGWEGFLAVEEEPFLWALYFDINDDGLKGKVRPGVRMLEIELTRKEKRWKKDIPARQEDQNTMHAADENETMHQNTPSEDAEATKSTESGVDGAGAKTGEGTPLTGSGLPSKELDLRNVDLSLGPSNKSHTSQSRMLSQRLARSNLTPNKDESRPNHDDDSTSVTTDMNQSVFSEPMKVQNNSYTPASSVQGEENAIRRQNSTINKPQESDLPDVPEIPKVYHNTEAKRIPRSPEKTPAARKSQWPGLPSGPKSLNRAKSTSKARNEEPEPHPKDYPSPPGSTRATKRLSINSRKNDEGMAQDNFDGSEIADGTSRFSADSTPGHNRSDSETVSALKNAISRLRGLSK